MKLLNHTVPYGIQSMSLNAYLKRAYPRIAPFALREAIAARDVRINGTRCRRDDTVSSGDEIKLYIADKYIEDSLSVLFEGGGLLVVDKPQGLPVDGDENGIGEDTLLARAVREYPSARLLHRLDTGTGGVILLSLDDKVHEAMLKAFRAETLGKEYEAYLCGHPSPDSGTWNNYISKSASSSLVTVHDAPVDGAKRAYSEYSVKETTAANGGVFSRVSIRIHTGRTHQIRAQAAHAGCPVLGDDKYGDRETNRLYHAAMPCLWCVRMELTGPDVPDELQGRTFESTPRFHVKRLFGDKTNG